MKYDSVVDLILDIYSFLEYNDPFQYCGFSGSVTAQADQVEARYISPTYLYTL